MDHHEGHETIEGKVVDETWSPLRAMEPEAIPLDASGGRVRILYRKWTGRERLAYEDAITERLLTTDERTGEDTVKLGSLRLFGASLTIVGAEGFDSIPGVPDGFLQGDRAARERDLLSITDPDTFSEIMRTAAKVQPLPGAEDAAAKGEDDDDVDPSRTPSTGPTPIGGADESESPVAS